MEKSYIGDVVFGASDGLITTFAVVAGVTGANLASQVVIILGLANLLADAVSMAAGNFLGHESEEEIMGRYRFHTPTRSAIAIFVAFVAAGLLPLLPYLAGLTGSFAFYLACFVTLLSAFLIGAVRTTVTKRNWLTSGLEMLAIGSVAALVAYLVGFFLKSLIS